MPTVDLATGATFYYEDAGDGAPVIALHGFLGTPRRHLGGIIDWLATDYRVIAPALRGYGESLPKPRDFPPDFYHRDARDVIAFMDALNIEQAHIVGYSDGGEVALIAAGLAPERFWSAASWGAVGYFGADMREFVQKMYPAHWMSDEERRDTGITDPDSFVLGWIQSVKGMIDAGGDVSVGLADKITCPVLLMLGDNDTLNPQAYGQRFIDRAQNGRLRMFRCGHAIHDALPDEFKQVVGEFLKSAG